ncbi:MAG: biopolymer transporter ExbD [Bacteroidota bacterium]
MRIVKRTGSRHPKVSMSVMSDVVLVILCLFLGLVSFCEKDRHLVIHLPVQSESKQLTHSSDVHYISIGKVSKVIQDKGCCEKPYHIKINDKFVRLSEIKYYAALLQEYADPMDRLHLTTSLRVDRDVPMGIVHDVKTALRKGGQIKLTYASYQKPEQE